MGRVRGYLAMSLDGFIASEEDDVAWLQEPRSSGLPLATGEWHHHVSGGLEFDDFLSTIGCIVMGRRTYDVVRGFPGVWPYGDTPMLVLTSRELSDAPESVTATHGTIEEAIAAARGLAANRDVYVDGGVTVRSALDAGLLDHLVVTILPTALGAGIPLLAGLAQRVDFSIEQVSKWGDGFVQLHLTTLAAPA